MTQDEQQLALLRQRIDLLEMEIGRYTDEIALLEARRQLLYDHRRHMQLSVDELQEKIINQKIKETHE